MSQRLSRQQIIHQSPCVGANFRKYALRNSYSDSYLASVPPLTQSRDDDDWKERLYNLANVDHLNNFHQEAIPWITASSGTFSWLRVWLLWVTVWKSMLIL